MNSLSGGQGAVGRWGSGQRRRWGEGRGQRPVGHPPEPFTRNPTPQTRSPTPQALSPTPYTLSPQPLSLNLASYGQRGRWGEGWVRNLLSPWWVRNLFPRNVQWISTLQGCVQRAVGLPLPFQTVAFDEPKTLPR